MTLSLLAMQFDEDRPSQPQRESSDRQELLHVCAYCSGQLVYPLDWIEEGSRLWRLILRCPDCEAIREGVFAQQAVDLFADELDRGESVLLSELKQATRENMAKEIDFFVRALQAGLIVPSDF
jgi:hypothetical protein